MRVGRFKTLGLIMVVLLVVSMAGCGSGGGGESETKFLTISTASTGGTYYPVGVGMATLWTEKLAGEGIRVSGQSSAGSVENVDILRNGEAELAIIQGLIGAMAWKGEGVFEGNRYEGLRSISMLWPNVEHFAVTKETAKTGNIMDIKGIRMSVGPSGSGTERSTLTILEGLGLTLDDITPEYLGYNEAAAAMKDGRIAGASMPAGPPVAAVSDLFASPIDVQVLEISQDNLTGINSVFDTWYQYEIPAGTYSGQDASIKTIAQPNWLAASDVADEEAIYKLTKTLFENLDYMYGVHDSAKNIKLETALSGLPAPLHPGAYKFYEEKGLDIPEKLVPPELK